MTEQDLRNNTNEDEVNTYSLRDIVMMIGANWMWFVAAIGICLAVAAFNIYSTPKVYTRSSAILIKDSRRGNVASSVFSDISSARVIPNVDNEIYLLGSQRMMTEVVKELNLNVWYTTKKGLRTDDLFGISPIEASFPDSDNKRTLGFKATKKNGALVLSEFHASGRDDIDESLKMDYVLGDTLSTPIGRIVINPTLYYDRYNDKQVIEVKKAGVDNTAISFMRKLSLDITSQMATVIQISISDVNTRRAELVLNTLMKVYQQDVIADKRQVSDISRKFIDDRLKLIESELAAEDDKILDFKEKNQVVDFQGQTSLSMNENSRFRSDIFNMQNQIGLVTYLRDYLDGETETTLIPINVGITDKYLNDLIAEYNKEVLHRDELLRNSNDRNPTIMSMNSALSAKFQGIMASIDNLLEQLGMNLEQMRTRERLALGSISSMPGQETQMLSYTRQQTVKEQLYLYLLNKKEETDLSSVLIDSAARIVEYAFGSNQPISPRPLRIFVLAILFGCMIPFVVLLLVNLLNTTVRSRKDLEERVSVPFFGEIPYLKSKHHSDVLVKAVGRDQISEAFRILRSNMSFMNVTGKMQVLLVTSTNEGSGKSFFSINMAITLVHAGKKVVLIDGDMRKRMLTRKYGDINSDQGFSKYLSDSSVSATSVVTENVNDMGVDMIFAGIQPPNPAELLMSSRLDELIAELRKSYDYVIIDSVPAFMIADAVISARVADHTVYVIREGLMDRRQLTDVEKMYVNSKLPNMMIVLNGIRESARKYKYGYGYGYGYGSYGYDGDDGEGKILKRIRRNKH